MPCGLCGATDSYLDEVVIDDRGGRLFVCSDTDHCAERRAAGHVGSRRLQGGSGMTDDTLLSGARPVAVVRRASPRWSMSMSIFGPARCSRWSANSGSGKTTLLNVLSGRLAPDAGAVWYRDPAGRPARRARDAGAGAAHAAPLRLGLRASGPAAEPAHERHRRRQCRRAADGAGRAALRRHPRPGDRLAEPGGDRRRPHRRHAAHLLRRHAATVADRAHAGDASAAGVHGRADRRRWTFRCRRGCSI